MLKKYAILSCLSFLSYSLLAEESMTTTCDSPYHKFHLGIRHTERQGVGYSTGYTTLEGFGTTVVDDYWLPFLDLRAHVFDNGKWAGNAGLGSRFVLSSIDHLLGVYCYYDIRQDRKEFTAQQFGPGIELLGKRMEYRINGYFPIGKDKSDSYHYRFDQFKGNQIFLQSKKRTVMTGGDGEAGVHLTQNLSYDIYAGAGPYYFSTSHNSSWGGKARLLGRYKEYISLEASYSYDRLFRNNVVGQISLNLPLGGKLTRKGRGCPKQIDLALSRAAFSPYRFEIPVIKTVKRTSLAKNSETGHPWRVWFVNNTSHSAGTFESPFPTLVQAQQASGPNDMIYVFSGDGTTQGMDNGISLQNGQFLFGSGIVQKLPTTKGVISIPQFSSNFPILTNGTGNVITLANDNHVSGIQSTLNAGSNKAHIHVPTAGSFIIANNILSGGTGFGVYVDNESVGSIFNNLITNMTQGIWFNQSFNGTITGNAISYCGSTGVEINGDFSGTICNNTISNVAAGIYVAATSTGNIIANTFSDGFADNAIWIAGSMRGNILDNKFINPIAAGIYLPMFSRGSVNNNSIQGGSGIIVQLTQDSCVQINANLLSQKSGIKAVGPNNGNSALSIAENVTQDGTNNLTVQSAAGGTICLDLMNNKFSQIELNGSAGTLNLGISSGNEGVINETNVQPLLPSTACGCP